MRENIRPSLRRRFMAVAAVCTLLASLLLATAPDAVATPTCNGWPATIHSGAATITGTPGFDVIVGGPADQFIQGGGGRDIICAGGGDDIIHGNTGRDWIEGGPGDDIIDGGKNDDELFGGYGEDTLVGGLGNDYISAGAGNDFIVGTQGVNTIYGGHGNDRLELAPEDYGFMSNGQINDALNSGPSEDLASTAPTPPPTTSCQFDASGDVLSCQTWAAVGSSRVW